MSLVSFVGPKPPTCSTSTQHQPADAPGGRAAGARPTMDMGCARSSAHRRQVQVLELDICYPAGLGLGGRHRGRLASLCAEAVDAIKTGSTSSSCPTAGRSRRGSHPIPRCSPPAIHHHLVREGLRTTRPRRRDRLGARGASLRAAGRIRRRRPSTRTSRWRRSRRLARTERRPLTPKRRSRTTEGGRQGAAEGHVQDGHLDLHEYCGAQIFEAIGLNRAPSTSISAAPRRPTSAGIGTSKVAEGGDPHAPPPAFGADRYRHDADVGGEYAWRVRGEEQYVDADAIAKLQHSGARPEAGATETFKDTRRSSTTSRAGYDAARPVRVPPRPGQGGAAGRGRAGEPRSSSASPPAPCRWPISTEAHDAGGRDEPHRRQEQHRRGRGRPGALPQRLKGIAIADGTKAAT